MTPPTPPIAPSGATRHPQLCPATVFRLEDPQGVRAADVLSSITTKLRPPLECPEARHCRVEVRVLSVGSVNLGAFIILPFGIAPEAQRVHLENTILPNLIATPLTNLSLTPASPDSADGHSIRLHHVRIPHSAATAIAAGSPRRTLTAAAEHDAPMPSRHPPSFLSLRGSPSRTRRRSC